MAATCSGGKEWQQCATACPLTCDNYDRDAAPVNCTESCIEGCACPEGKVELDGVCVEPSTCASILNSISNPLSKFQLPVRRCSVGCGECEEGQQCSAVIADNGVRVVCDPIAGISMIMYVLHVYVKSPLSVQTPNLEPMSLYIIMPLSSINITTVLKPVLLLHTMMRTHCICLTDLCTIPIVLR